MYELKNECLSNFTIIPLYVPTYYLNYDINSTVKIIIINYFDIFSINNNKLNFEWYKIKTPKHVYYIIIFNFYEQIIRFKCKPYSNFIYDMSAYNGVWI